MELKATAENKGGSQKKSDPGYYDEHLTMSFHGI